MQDRNSTRPYRPPTDAPIVPYTPDGTRRPRTDGGPKRTRPRFEPPPETDYAEPYTRDYEEIEPGVADLR